MDKSKVPRFYGKHGGFEWHFDVAVCGCFLESWDFLRLALCLTCHLSLMILVYFVNDNTRVGVFDVWSILSVFWHWKLYHYLTLNLYVTVQNGRKRPSIAKNRKLETSAVSPTGGGNVRKNMTWKKCPTPMLRNNLADIKYNFARKLTYGKQQGRF